MRDKAKTSYLAEVAIAVCAVLPFAAVADTGLNVLGNGGFAEFSGERRLLVVNATREQQSASLSCDGFPSCRLALAPLETLLLEQLDCNE